MGSVLYLTATVAYTDPSVLDSADDLLKNRGSDEASGSKFTKVQIRVDSKVRNVEHGEVKPTGQFNYTFLVPKDIKVMPRTYSEFMIWVDARRRAEQAQTSDGRAEGQGMSHDDGKAQRATE